MRYEFDVKPDRTKNGSDDIKIQSTHKLGVNEVSRIMMLVLTAVYAIGMREKYTHSMRAVCFSEGDGGFVARPETAGHTGDNVTDPATHRIYRRSSSRR